MLAASRPVPAAAAGGGARRTAAAPLAAPRAARLGRGPAAPRAGAVSDSLSSRVRDFDGNYGTGTPSPIPERLLESLDPWERASAVLFHTCSPSVVNISTSAEVMRLFPLNMMQARPMPRGWAARGIPRGVGSGFIWDKAGHVVTNAHVISGSTDVKVTLFDQTTYRAKVIGRDREKDVAVLRLLDVPRQKAALLKPVAVGSSSDLLVGQRVFAIGNPFGLDQSMSSGIVSGLGRELPVSQTGVPITNVIQTDAAINPGNSGAPPRVFLRRCARLGELVGINTAILSGSGSSSGVGFAIPVDSAKGLVQQILEFGRVVRPYLGVALAPATMAQRLGAAGAVVLSVAPGGPAAAAGVRPSSRELLGLRLGDVITALNGRPVKSEKDLFAALDECRPGQRVPLTVRGDGGRDPERALSVTLAERTVSVGE
ncbi:protease Do-like chloroplastic [Raphidocelis subcapitata]|uniref:Protease Do-like chloroplastic n=1 Tax=Raphidocelis subcapitata TaxID=307507 RepID=A0A2V0P783_9CHLO|nr:protease Do-like chloroplastic [Raphidocelis subcapitata]|eukprot:GBF95718.1 protease Do-like chloroplastic [Raphidocelis subcapitata]